MGGRQDDGLAVDDLSLLVPLGKVVEQLLLARSLLGVSSLGPVGSVKTEGPFFSERVGLLLRVVACELGSGGLVDPALMGWNDAPDRLAILHLHRVDLDPIIVSHRHLHVLGAAQEDRIRHLPLLDLMHFILQQSVLLGDFLVLALVAEVAFLVAGTLGWQVVVLGCDVVPDVVEALLVLAVGVAVNQLLGFGLDFAHLYNYWDTKFIIPELGIFCDSPIGFCKRSEL